MIDYRLGGKVAVITGAGSGIGEQCARVLSSSGASVVVSDLDLSAAERVVESLEGPARAVRADVSDPASVDALFQEAVANFGPVHVAVNNAGIGGEQAATADYTTEGWRKVISVNLDGVFYGTRAAVRGMRDGGGGSVVNMASILGQVGFPHACAYVAAKHGVVGLTRSAAIEHAQDGVRVNAVGPGFVHTPLLDANLDEETLEALVAQHPVGRLGHPDEVAQLVAWLASDASGFVTGGYYAVDGGYLAR